jgi:hypothetical protein
MLRGKRAKASATLGGEPKSSQCIRNFEYSMHRYFFMHCFVIRLKELKKCTKHSFKTFDLFSGLERIAF